MEFLEKHNNIIDQHHRNIIETPGFDMMKSYAMNISPMDSHGMIVHLPTILPYKSTIHVGKYTRQPMGILWEQEKKNVFFIEGQVW